MTPADAITAVRYFGIYPILIGTWHRLAKKTGLLKSRFPAVDWGNLSLKSFLNCDLSKEQLKTQICPNKFFPVATVTRNKNVPDNIGISKFSVIKLADNIATANFRYFSKSEVQHQMPVNWHFNPFSGAVWEKDVHWCDIKHFDSLRGDIKCVWEISRFSWAYDLLRAYRLTSDESYPKAFWELFEHWLENNQPNHGVNWVSGQECAIRVMAWCFALFGFINSPETTQDRIERMLVAIALHCERIEKFISHAIRQKTNHSITEAAGLYTIGILFPFFKNAVRWKNLGKKILEQEASRQIYDDGAYVQQSMNYHRVMLQAYLWCLRLAQMNEDSFSAQLKSRFIKATEFLYQMQDNSTGRVSNYGPNDGALILPLNSCDYLDYRPVIQACWYLYHQEKLYDAGPWDEDLLWLFGPESLDAPRANAQRVSSEFREGGYYTLRSNDSWAMIRCHTYRDRVGHVDMLHLDLWADGINLLRDCGSYKYYAPDEPELEEYFKSIWAHNTVVVDDASPLRQISRFIWFPWPKTKVLKFEENANRIEWEGGSYAYNRPPWNIVHSRHIVTDKDGQKWKITDKLAGQGQHKAELRWHLPYESEIVEHGNEFLRLRLFKNWGLEIKAVNKIETKLLKSSINGGWESLYYSHKQPIKTLCVSSTQLLPVTFTTTIWTHEAQNREL